jgi:DNA repair protein RecN (Recombination protein N)
VLDELSVRHFGVIRQADVTFEGGLTAITGETGAGKSLIIGAISLLMGTKASPSLVQPGAQEATVEARLIDGSDETIVKRVISSTGRSRAYLNGSLASASDVAAVVGQHVELLAQHAAQRLAQPAEQRLALDRFGGLEGLVADVAQIADDHKELERQLEELGGDDRARAREIELLTYQIEEIDAANLDDPDEEQLLARRQDELGQATRVRDDGGRAAELLTNRVLDSIGEAISTLDGLSAFTDVLDRLSNAQEELGDIARSVRTAAEDAESDPQALDAVVNRRQQIADLKRKYGSDVPAILEYRRQLGADLDRLTRFDEHRQTTLAKLDERRRAYRAGALELHEARVAAAAAMAPQVEAELAALALPHATFSIDVSHDPDGHPARSGSDTIRFMFCANPGQRPAPLGDVASGGELSRALLAVRVVGSLDVPTLIFDEIDAGIGGEAGAAMGSALAGLSKTAQVLCVTHLAQVAAYADQHLEVRKAVDEGDTVVTISPLNPAHRVDELSRMLSGVVSDSARQHARELLTLAQAGQS